MSGPSLQDKDLGVAAWEYAKELEQELFILRSPVTLYVEPSEGAHPTIYRHTGLLLENCLQLQSNKIPTCQAAVILM